MTVQDVKQRFGIIGNSVLLNRAISIANQVASTDMSVLITGESGTGKEVFSKIIHQLSHRKHGSYIAVNCGAIPEGTIDSELFGHEKGAFTGAQGERKGYFEVVNDGTIFLDEVGELPLSTQVRLLRVLETGEFFRVGSSKSVRTNVRIVAATNVNLEKAIESGKFREDLYYRLNTVPIIIPALRERGSDIHLLFRKFSADFSEKYKMPPIRLSEDAVKVLEDYRWKGNVRQLKNITEQISVIEEERNITVEALRKYLPIDGVSGLPAIAYSGSSAENISDRELLYKVLFDMRRDIAELKATFFQFMSGQVPENENFHSNRHVIPESVISKEHEENHIVEPTVRIRTTENDHTIDGNHEEVEEILSLQDKEIEMIKKALEKHKGKRKKAAQELGISERTLYRKIKEYNIKG